MRKQEGLSLIGVLLILGALVITTGGVLVWQKKISPTPTPTPQTQPTASPEEPTDQCSGLNEKECLANSDCLPVYGPSCPACMDIRFERCRNRLSCQTSADCPPSLGVCGEGNCPSWRCISGRCVYFKDADDFAACLKTCLEVGSVEECNEEFGR